MPSNHDDESSLPGGDHDTCVSRREFRTFRTMLEGVSEDVKRLMECIMISTPERGSMLDVQRKQEAEITLLRAEVAALRSSQQTQAAPLPRRILETIAFTSASTLTVLVIALIGKGMVISIVTEAMRLAGGAK